jgi:hypothetical protein
MLSHPTAPTSGFLIQDERCLTNQSHRNTDHIEWVFSSVEGGKSKSKRCMIDFKQRIKINPPKFLLGKNLGG